MVKIRLPLRKRVDNVIQKLDAAARTHSPGVVELPTELFDDMASVLEELAEKVFGAPVKKD